MRCAAVLLALAVAASTSVSARSAAPELIFETLGTDHGARARLGDPDEEQLRSVARLVGLDVPGAPIRVVLASEDTEVARGTRSWIAGFAHSASDTVVLFPARSLRYPHDSLQAVLHHEIAHILIGRAAGGAGVPRWFNEGLATVAERPWHFEDRRQLAWVLLTRGRLRMAEVESLFERGPAEASGAYAMSAAFVRDLIDQHGPATPSRLLEAVRGGASFEAAFVLASGEPLHAAERRFTTRLTSWERWVPLLTSPFVVWTFVTLLALYAIAIRRRTRAERRRRWDEEEEAERAALSSGASVASLLVEPPGGRPPRGADGLDDEPPPSGGRR